jgi:hypothetical protein
LWTAFRETARLGSQALQDANVTAGLFPPGGRGERVRMVVTADPHPDSEMTRLATQGLASQLRQFDSVLASRRGKVQRG